MSVTVIFLADVADPSDPQGRSYREVNAQRSHRLPLGGLVEVKSTGVRMFVVQLGRDCDASPMCWLAATLDEPEGKWYGGIGEDSLSLVRPPPGTLVMRMGRPCSRGTR